MYMVTDLYKESFVYEVQSSEPPFSLLIQKHPILFRQSPLWTSLFGVKDVFSTPSHFVDVINDWHTELAFIFIFTGSIKCT